MENPVDFVMFNKTTEICWRNFSQNVCKGKCNLCRTQEDRDTITLTCMAENTDDQHNRAQMNSKTWAQKYGRNDELGDVGQSAK